MFAHTNDSVRAITAAAEDMFAVANNITIVGNNSTSNQTTATTLTSTAEEINHAEALLNYVRNINNLFSHLGSMSGSISFIASSAVLYHILRSHKGLSTTYHRLVFGLCFADVIFSFAAALGQIMSPKEASYYIPNAHGNVATCSFQGFLGTSAVNCVAIYNCSICFYYLAIVKYNKNDGYIKSKLEPWFHGVAAVVPMAMNATLLMLKAFNPSGSTCFAMPYYPPHCNGYEDGDTPDGYTIPCGRGNWARNFHGLSDSGKSLLMIGAQGLMVVVTPFVIVITMAMMFRSLLKVEKRLQSFGAGALRLKALKKEGTSNEGGTSTTHNAERCGGFMGKLKCLIQPCFGREKKPASRSNRTVSQKRSILYMALGYALAWAFTWAPFFCMALKPNYTTGVLGNVLTPLQGLFNLVVYMAPKVRNAKNSRRQKVSWCQAIARAWTSKGDRRVDNSLGRGTNTRSRNWGQSLMKTISSPLFKQISGSYKMNKKSSITTKNSIPEV